MKKLFKEAIQIKLLPILIFTLMFASCGMQKEKESKEKLTKTMKCTVPANIESGLIEMLSDCYREVSFGEDKNISLTINKYDITYYDLYDGVLLMYQDSSKSNPIYAAPAGNNNGVYGSWRINTNEQKDFPCILNIIIKSSDYTISATCTI